MQGHIYITAIRYLGGHLLHHQDPHLRARLHCYVTPSLPIISASNTKLGRVYTSVSSGKCEHHCRGRDPTLALDTASRPRSCSLLKSRPTCIMRSEPLLHQHLPTPPMHSTECPSELSPIAHYNADGSHAFGEGSHGSPGPVMHHRHPSRADSHSGSALGLGIHYVRSSAK